MDNIRYRVFKISINIPFLHTCLDSRVYKIRSKLDLVVPVFFHSLVTILFGFWGWKIVKSMNALHTNFSGGEDHSNTMIASEFDEETNVVWNNLSRSTSEKINRQGVEILLREQEKYMETNEDVFSTSNVYHLKNALTRAQYPHIVESDIEDFFEAVKILYQLEQ